MTSVLAFQLTLNSYSWFFGFLSASETTEILRYMQPGSFLFRFSGTSPKNYTLSVTTDAGIAHWRITCFKITGAAPAFKIGNTVYKSLPDIIRTHNIQPLEN